MELADLDQLPSWAAQLLDEARVGRLGLLDPSGAPRVLPVAFAVAAGRIWSAIDQKPKRSTEPARVRYLRHDPRAALTVDHYSEAWDRLAWVQALGRIEVLAAAEAAPALATLARKYPQYRQQPPPGPVLALEVERCLCWRSAPPA